MQVRGVAEGEEGGAAAGADVPLAALIETVLFLESEPVSSAVLARVSGAGLDDVESALDEIRARCDSESSGISLREVAGGWQLAPRAECWERVQERYGRRSDGKLSRSALETLTIIAYKQPITRAEIEAIRGVPPDSMIRQLVDRRLVRDVGRKDAPGRPALFGTTDEFLRFFRLKSIADLPRLDEKDEERFRLAR